MTKDRDKAGQFAEGNQAAKGHGRPRKPPAEYLAAVAEELSIDAWRNIIQKAIGAAMEGDHRAREWVTRMFLDASKMEAEIRSHDLMGSISDTLKKQQSLTPEQRDAYFEKIMAERDDKDN